MPLTVAPTSAAPPPFLDRDRLAADHRLVDRAAPAHHYPVDRNPLARAYAQHVADLDVGERDILLATARNAVRDRRREAQQRAERRAGPVAGPQFQHLSQQHQHDDDDRGVEVRLHAARHPEPGRKQPGRDRGRHAVGEGRSHAERDKREHVGAAVDYRRPPALEERSPRPEHHGRRERKLNPVGGGAADQQRHALAEQHLGHRQQKHRRADGRADAKAPRHVRQLRTLRRAGSYRERLERHAAARARPRLGLTHLGTHRADVDDVRPDRRRGSGGGRVGRRGRGPVTGAEKGVRVALERGLTAAAAKEVGRAGVLVGMPGRLRIHDHAADRIAGFDCHGLSLDNMESRASLCPSLPRTGRIVMGNPTLAFPCAPESFIRTR